MGFPDEVQLIWNKPNNNKFAPPRPLPVPIIFVRPLRSMPKLLQLTEEPPDVTQKVIIKAPLTFMQRNSTDGSNTVASQTAYCC